LNPSPGRQFAQAVVQDERGAVHARHACRDAVVVRGQARGDEVGEADTAQCREIEVDHDVVFLLRSARARGYAAACATAKISVRLVGAPGAPVHDVVFDGKGGQAPDGVAISSCCIGRSSAGES